MVYAVPNCDGVCYAQKWNYGEIKKPIHAIETKNIMET